MAEIFKKPRKKFAETGFGKFVIEHAPDAAILADKLITGGKIGEAIDFVKNKLSDSAQSGDPAAVEASEDFQLKMSEFKIEMQKLYLEEMKLEVEDKQNARGRETAFLAAGKRDFMVPVLSFVAVFAFFFAMYIIAYAKLPQENREMFVHCLGIIEGAMLVPVFQYVFGTSASSKRKTEILNSKS